MKLKVPKYEWSSLKTGVWGNTWRNWGLILLAFSLLYAFEAGYFTGMLFAGKGIRGQDWRTIPSEFFGPFDRSNLPAMYAPAQKTLDFNRPDGCVEGQVTVDVVGVPVQKPNGLETCDSSHSSFRWSLFPWVKDTNAAGAFPGCADAVTTVINSESSPAFVGSPSPNATNAQVCQNFIPNYF